MVTTPKESVILSNSAKLSRFKKNRNMSYTKHEKWKAVPKLIIHIPMRSILRANLATLYEAPAAIMEKTIHPIACSSQVHHEHRVIITTKVSIAEYKLIVMLKYLLPKNPIKIPRPIKKVPEM